MRKSGRKRTVNGENFKFRREEKAVETKTVTMYRNFINFQRIKISVASDHGAFGLVLVSGGCCDDHSRYLSHLGVFLISVKPFDHRKNRKQNYTVNL